VLNAQVLADWLGDSGERFQQLSAAGVLLAKTEGNS